MPKVKLSRYAEKEVPPIDWLWAAVLERKTVLGYDLKQMAKVADVGYDMMRQYIRMSPWDWSPRVRKNICKEFGISTKVSVGRTELPDEAKYRRTRT